MNDKHSELPVLVAGGGIGGLAAALALVRQGFSVQVFEQAPEIGEIGAGIMRSTNTRLERSTLARPSASVSATRTP